MGCRKKSPISSLPPMLSLHCPTAGCTSWAATDSSTNRTSNPGLTPIYTIPTAMAIDFGALVSAVKSGKPLDASFAAANIATFDDPNLQITGGALKVFNNKMLLILGHTMNGLYTAGGGTMTQTYSSSVRVWEMSATRAGTS